MDMVFRGATIADGTGTGTITDDDPMPTLTINDVSVTEGDTGTVAATFTVSLSPFSGRNSSTTSGGTTLPRGSLGRTIFSKASAVNE